MPQKVTQKQPNSKMCVVCGLKNDAGLKAKFFETEKNEVIALFKPRVEHQSYPGRLHGGMAAAILDEAIGRAIRIKYGDELWGVTAELTIRFKKPIPLDDELRVRGRITNENGRMFEGSGELLLSSGEVCATATGKYVKLPLEKIADFNVSEQEWKVTTSPDDPSQFHLD